MGIERNIVSRTSGSGDSLSQTFYSNALALSQDGQTSPFEFDVPTYILNGATFDFYNQTTEGISASLNNIKTLLFLFSGNTQALSGATKMRHDVYRIDYNTFSAFTNAPFVSGATATTVTGIAQSAQTTSAATQGTVVSTPTTDIFSAITNPIYTLFEDVSGSTFLVGTAHTLTLPQKIKPAGQYTQDLFMDKAQYFVDSTFMFDLPLDQTVGDVQMLSGNQIVELYNMPFSSNTFIQSTNSTHTVTGGTLSGTSISGANFTYFTPPKKADIFVVDGIPAVTGSLNTFSPIFAFKNVEDGDYYKVQVSYNTGDTAFTGDTTIFKFQPQPGNAEYVRAVGAAVTPNSEFLYRVGNTKEIINLFQVKQNVTTWSESVYAIAANDGTYILSGHTWLGHIGGSPISSVTVSLTVQTSISNVDLGSDTLVDPSITSESTSPLGGGVGSTVSVYSDSSGYFTFGKINGGNYTVTAVHPDPINFPTQTFNIFITSSTNLDIIFSILWGNTNIDFTQPYTFL